MESRHDVGSRSECSLYTKSNLLLNRNTAKDCYENNPLPSRLQAYFREKLVNSTLIFMEPLCRHIQPVNVEIIIWSHGDACSAKSENGGGEGGGGKGRSYF